ncbi:uncharacterized protein LOC129766051 [Toxorhynchites rutilus septentrionalis]|uniref:uncharacterized protein LOC129766051 n=1 Tax=Toxorhynchites rutilus septentrionalis TaxID=329112 RepID=UPI0024786D85|nr:uncharacterized protein LOC129766051 [Toxorhynchites rutilus septentrionalis]
MFRCEQIESSRLAKEWRDWKGALEYYFDSYQIIDQKIKRSKMLHFGGPQLQRVFESLDGIEEFPLVLLERPYYDVAIDRLDAYFKPRSQDVLERHKLRNMKQCPNERFSHYVLRIRQQLMDCGLEKYSKEIRNVIEEIMLIDVIVEGCNSPELRRKIHEKDQSAADIEALGESLESVHNQERELKVGTNSDRVDQSEICKIGTHKAKTLMEREGKLCVMLVEIMVIFLLLSECRKCRKTGHFERVCRKCSSNPEVLSSPKKVRVIDGTNPLTQDVLPSEKETEKKVHYTFYTGNQANVFDCNIGGVPVEVLIDSGSDVNLITDKTWKLMKAQHIAVSKCEKGSEKILRAYGSSKPLSILGTFMAVVEIGNRATEATFYVVDGGQRNLLGDVTSKKLAVLKIGLEVNAVAENAEIKRSPFPEISGVQVRIQMDPNITPVFQPLRRVPIPLENAVNEKLDELLKRDIIEVKTGPATWVSPLVVAIKTNGSFVIVTQCR